MRQVLISSQALRDLPGTHIDLLREAGFSVRFPAQPLVSERDVVAALENCAAVIAGNEPYGDAVLAALPRLRVIARAGVGYDNVDVQAATRRSIAVTITPQANHQAVAEHTLALMLAVARSIVTQANSSRAGVWLRRGLFIPLRGRTLGIVGLGRIGHSVAVRASAFGMRLLACEPLPDVEFMRKYAIELVDLDTLLARSDFVSLHVPLTDLTRGMINRQTLARMKPGSVLVNTARGGVVVEADLVDALRSGHLAGAAVDVLSSEPPPADHPLLPLENVIVTAHVASFDAQAIEDMVTGAAGSIAALYAGRWPSEEIVNPELEGLWRP